MTPTPPDKDELNHIITKIRAGKDPDTGELHITDEEAKQAIEALIASKVEKAKTLPKALEHAYKIRIAELEKQIKVVEDFAYVIQALQSKEGEM